MGQGAMSRLIDALTIKNTICVLSTWIVNTKILGLFLTGLLFTACSEEPPFKKNNYINFSDDPTHQQMVAAANSLPPKVELEDYRHFHIIDETGNQQRMIINLHRSFTRKGTRAISVGCDNKAICELVVAASLRLISEENPLRDDLLLILPSYMDPPYSEAEKAGVAIEFYDIPNLKSIFKQNRGI